MPLFVNKNIATFVWSNTTGGFILDWKVSSAHRRSSVRISFDACARLTLCAHVVFLGGGSNLCAQALQITGAHEKVLYCMNFSPLLLAGIQVF